MTSQPWRVARPEKGIGLGSVDSSCQPFLIGLLESDQIPYEMVGTHRRVPIDEVLRFREERSRGRRQALRHLSEEADELGIYTD
jgi:hypothetical protein